MKLCITFPWEKALVFLIYVSLFFFRWYFLSNCHHLDGGIYSKDSGIHMMLVILALKVGA
jgi:hypothetical protein